MEQTANIERMEKEEWKGKEIMLFARAHLDTILNFTSAQLPLPLVYGNNRKTLRV